jgi:hypothetical protein
MLAPFEKYLMPLLHYVCIGLLIVLLYFVGAALLDHAHPVTGTVVAQPTADPKVQAAQVLAQALTNANLASAVNGQNVALSAAQQTVASAVQAYTGADARIAGAIAAGLTQGPPQRQVVTASTSVGNGAYVPPSPGPNDDAIQRDMKTVLAETPVKVDATTKVQVSWEDVPFSPISAVYTSDGASGIGWTVHKAPALEVNLLGLTNKGALEPGFDIEHIIKGTSLGLGLGATYDMRSHKVDPQLAVHIHF